MFPFLIGGLAGLAIAGPATATRFEREASAELGSRLSGSGKRVTVRARPNLESLFGVVPSITISASHFSSEGLPFHVEPGRSRYGKLRRLHLHLEDFSLAGLGVERLETVVSDCRFDMGLALAHHRFRLSKSGFGDVTVTVRDRSFEPFILAKFPEVRSVSVKMADGLAQISGFAQFGPFGTQFRVESKVGVRNGTQLVFIDPQVSLASGKPDPRMGALVVQLFDPILDLDKDLHLEHAVTVESLELRGGVMIGRGKLTIPPEGGR